MTATSHDSVLHEMWARTLQFHPRIVVALQRDYVQADKSVQKHPRHAAKIGCITDPGAEPLNDKSIRSVLIVRERDGLDHNFGQRLEPIAVERMHKLTKPLLLHHDFAERLHHSLQIPSARMMAEEPDLMPRDGRSPCCTE